MGTKTADDCPRPEWLEALEDPVREQALSRGAPRLDEILKLFPRPKGDAPFDAEVIAGSVERLKPSPAVNTGHPFLDLSVKTGLAYIDATFQGDQPKYGVKHYGRNEHDTFPPTIIAAVDALSAWGLMPRAAQVLRYWLTNFVRADGGIEYYGPSLSEYGQLLHTAALLEERAAKDGPWKDELRRDDWWERCFPPLDRMAERLLRLLGGAAEDGLIAGCPEADEKELVRRYFHNNAWVATGLRRWAGLCEARDLVPSTPAGDVRRAADTLAAATLRAIEKSWPKGPGDWWLTPQADEVKPEERPSRKITETRLGSYTNYRYWPELLSSGLLPDEMALRLVNARLRGGGQFCGATRFSDWLDDWPLFDHLAGLRRLGRKDDFLLCLYGHIAYHQAEGHLAAYEQVTLPPGKEKAPYCLPCQLVAARAARLLVEWDRG